MRLRVDLLWPAGYSLPKTVAHSSATGWDIEDGCLRVDDATGAVYYPLTSVARFAVERP